MVFVLVVDDEEDVKPLFLQRFRRELKKNLVKFDFAFSGQQALDHLSSLDDMDCVLILSDINMPGMSGLDLLKEIKSRYPELRVMMVTAYGDDDNYKKAMEFGADGFLNKPVDFSHLKKTILES